MKDRPGDAVSPNSPNHALSRIGPVRAVLAHFWKVLAVTSLVAGACIWYSSRSGWSGASELLETETSSDDGAPRGHPHHFRLMRELIDKQSQPATIVFKNQAPSALGYLASVDNECVVLRSFYKEESKEQTILIPWENVLYIRLNTSVPPGEQVVTASRDPRSKPVARPRR